MLLPLTSTVARQPFRLSPVTMEIGAGSSINPAKAAFVPFGCLPPPPGTRLTAPAGSHKSNHPTLLLHELLNLIPLKRIIKNQVQKSSESTVICFYCRVAPCRPEIINRNYVAFSTSYCQTSIVMKCPSECCKESCYFRYINHSRYSGGPRKLGIK
jgi:hypothetical protein